MPPRTVVSANPGPVSAPSSPDIEVVPATIDSYPSPQTSSGLVLPLTEPLDADLPGPSSLFIPRLRSLPLPDFPPDSDSDADTEDEIVARLPIYLSPALHPNLHLFQYPVDAGTDVWRDDRARELGFVLDVGAGNGEAVEGGYGFGGRGTEREKEKEKTRKKGKEEKWGDKLRLRSEAVPSATGYYSGIVHDGEEVFHAFQWKRPRLRYGAEDIVVLPRRVRCAPARAFDAPSRAQRR